MAYTQGRLARAVIGLGTQEEPTDRVPTGAVNGVVYKERLPDGGWHVELSDGSTWRLPPQGQCPPVDQAWVYAQLGS